MKAKAAGQSRLAEELGEFRMTKQRKVVYDVLMSKRDHPTASEVFDRTKSRMPSISLATVYNCLETLTQCGLVKQVNVDREASRYCPNLKEHAHFFCESCGTISDVVLKEGMDATGAWQLPEGSVVDHVEFAIKGSCPKCLEAEKASR
ncbi:MAG: transcriptional repressor [Verrucomicrobiota bacterium]